MGLDAEFEKLTVWCLYRNVLSFIALSGAVNFAELPFTNVKTGSIIFAAESDFVAFLARILTLFADYFVRHFIKKAKPQLNNY